MFDPFDVYHREQRKTHKGQIIRKKPTTLQGSVSSKDLPLLETYAKALGYYLLPIDSPVSQYGSSVFYYNMGHVVTNTSSGPLVNISFASIRNEMSNLEPILNIPPTLVERINKVTIYSTVNAFRLFSEPSNPETYRMNIKFYNDHNISFNLNPDETVIFNYTTQNAAGTNIQGHFFDGTGVYIPTYYGSQLGIATPYGPVATKIEPMLGEDARLFYQRFKQPDYGQLSLYPIISTTLPPLFNYQLLFNCTFVMVVDFSN